MQRGKIVILVMVAVAIALASFAWWHRYQQGRRSLQLWGTQSAQLIRHARHVELLTLGTAPPRDGEESLEIEGRQVGIVKREDISATRGLVHARHVLIEDASFDWDRTAADCGGDWSYALQFSEGKEKVTLALDLKCGRALLLEKQTDVRIIERISKALAKYIGDHFERPLTSSSETASARSRSPYRAPGRRRGRRWRRFPL